MFFENQLEDRAAHEMESLKVASLHWLHHTSATGNALEMYDFTIYSFFAVALPHNVFDESQQPFRGRLAENALV